MTVLAFAESIQLFPDGTIFLHITLILVMIWVLNRTFFKPINAILASRARHKGGRGGEAAEILREVAKKQKEYDEKMLAVRLESYELIERERAEAVEMRERTIAEARAAAAKRVADEKAQIEKQVMEARVEIALEANKTAEKIASNILKV